MRVKIIACEVMKEELRAIPAAAHNDIEFISMGLHLYPEKLGRELQCILDKLTGYDRVVLAFGLCGGAAKNLRAGDFILTIPRVHDCIALLLGSQEQFEQKRREEKGTLYLSGGWFKGERSFTSEFERVRQKYGEKKANRVYRRMYDGYRRVLFIHTRHPQEEECLARSKQISDFLSLAHQTIEGNLTYIERIAAGPWDESDFINIPPRGMIDESAFFRHFSIPFPGAGSKK